MRILALIIIGISSVIHAEDKPDADPIKQELDRLRGTWQLVSAKTVGSTIPDVPDDLVKLVKERYDGDKIYTIHDNKEIKDVVKRIVINPSASPKEMDVHVEYMGKKKVIKAIYILAADKLTIASGDDDGPRPKSFDEKGQTVGVMKRVEK